MKTVAVLAAALAGGVCALPAAATEEAAVETVAERALGLTETKYLAVFEDTRPYLPTVYDGLYYNMSAAPYAFYFYECVGLCPYSAPYAALASTPSGDQPGFITTKYSGSNATFFNFNSFAAGCLTTHVIPPIPGACDVCYSRIQPVAGNCTITAKGYPAVAALPPVTASFTYTPKLRPTKTFGDSVPAADMALFTLPFYFKGLQKVEFTATINNSSGTYLSPASLELDNLDYSVYSS